MKKQRWVSEDELQELRNNSRIDNDSMLEYNDLPEMKNGGYVVTKSSDRKGKTHKVTGPDGTVKYFGDSKLGQHPKDPKRKAAFYARHKSNLEGNPFFRAFARKTWEEGGAPFDFVRNQGNKSSFGDYNFNKFKETLPDNLKNPDSEDYNMMGYWESLGKPEQFDYSQPKESDGMYHAFSRNPKTGEMLKYRNHPTFNSTLQKDAEMGYNAYESPDGKIYTFGAEDVIPKDYKPFKYAAGGTAGPKPIYTSNRNDPRLQNYNDSVSLVKAPFESYKISKKQDDLEAKGKFKEANIIKNKTRYEIPSFKALKNLTKLNNVEPTPIKGSMTGWGLHPSDKTSPRFKEPFQPVFFQEEPTTPLVFTETPSPLNPNAPKQRTTGIPFLAPETTAKETLPTARPTPSSSSKPIATMVRNAQTGWDTPKVKIKFNDGTEQVVSPAEYDKWAKKNPNHEHQFEMGGELQKFPDGGPIPITWGTNKTNAVDNTRVAPPITPLPKLSPAEMEKRKQFYERVKVTTEKNELARKKKVVEDRKARINDSVEAQKVPYTTDNFADLTARLSQATGDKLRFSNEENIFDDYINPFAMIGDMASGLGRVPLNIKQENYGDAALNIATPLLAGRMIGSGSVNPFGKKMWTNSISDEAFVNNLGLGIPKFAEKAANKTVNNVKAINEHIYGILDGVKDKRPFSEKFPITKSQKAKVYSAQDNALKEGKQFLQDWHYGDSMDNLHPDIIKKMQEMDPWFKPSPYDNTSRFSFQNPFVETKDALISTRRKLLKNENISNESKEYSLENRNRVAGFNSSTTNESLTNRNRGLYHYSPEKIKDTGIHEGTHTAQRLGENGPFEGPISNIATYNSRVTSYPFANPNSPEGALFKEAMVETIPHVKDADGLIIKKGYKWEASPKELHSELAPARAKLIDAYEVQGYNRKEVMDQIRADVTDDQIDWMINANDLNRFFKKETSPELKRQVIRMLYTSAPVATGLGAAYYNSKNPANMQQNEFANGGGILKPKYEVGGEYEVSDAEYKRLLKLGYELE